MSGDVRPDLSQSLLLEMMQQVSALSGQIGVVQGQNNLIIAEQKHAAEGRQVIYAKLSRIDTIEQTVVRIAPLVDKHEKTHNETTGALTLGKTLWAAGAGAFGAGATFLVQWVTGGKIGH